MIYDGDAYDRLADGPIYWSSTTARTARGHEIRECSVVTSPASVGLQPLKVWPGDIAASYWDPRRSDHEMRAAGAGLLVEARSITKTHAHRYSRHLSVVDIDVDDDEFVTSLPRDTDTHYRFGQQIRLPNGEVGTLEIRPAGRILSVGGRRVRRS